MIKDECILVDESDAVTGHASKYDSHRSVLRHGGHGVGSCLCTCDGMVRPCSCLLQTSRCAIGCYKSPLPPLDMRSRYHTNRS